MERSTLGSMAVSILLMLMIMVVITEGRRLKDEDAAILKRGVLAVNDASNEGEVRAFVSGRRNLLSLADGDPVGSSGATTDAVEAIRGRRNLLALGDSAYSAYSYAGSDAAALAAVYAGASASAALSGGDVGVSGGGREDDDARTRM